LSPRRDFGTRFVVTNRIKPGENVSFWQIGEEATMRRLLVLLVLLAVGVGALGYYRGWFKVSTADKDKAVPVDVTLDRDKLKQDTERAKAKVEDVTGQAKAKAGEIAGGKGKKEAAKKETATKGPGDE
jgi:hypothetical protein